MLPCSLAIATVMPFLPLALEIDPGVIQPGIRVGNTYQLRILMTATDGRVYDFDYEAGPTTNPELYTSQLRITFDGRSKWEAYHGETATTLLAWKGVPLAKFTVTCNGPPPSVRWVTRPWP